MCILLFELFIMIKKDNIVLEYSHVLYSIFVILRFIKSLLYTVFLIYFNTIVYKKILFSLCDCFQILLVKI